MMGSPGLNHDCHVKEGTQGHTCNSHQKCYGLCTIIIQKFKKLLTTNDVLFVSFCLGLSCLCCCFECTYFKKFKKANQLQACYSYGSKIHVCKNTQFLLRPKIHRYTGCKRTGFVKPSSVKLAMGHLLHSEVAP